MSATGERWDHQQLQQQPCGRNIRLKQSSASSSRPDSATCNICVDLFSTSWFRLALKMGKSGCRIDRDKHHCCRLSHDNHTAALQCPGVHSTSKTSPVALWQCAPVWYRLRVTAKFWLHINENQITQWALSRHVAGSGKRALLDTTKRLRARL